MQLVTDPTVFAFQLPVIPGNWSDSSSFLATISQSDVDSLSTLVSEISQDHNGNVATMAAVLDMSSSRRSSSGTISNQTALFEKNTRSQQDQCWETYVGQVLFCGCCGCHTKSTDFSDEDCIYVILMCIRLRTISISACAVFKHLVLDKR